MAKRGSNNRGKSAEAVGMTSPAPETGHGGEIHQVAGGDVPVLTTQQGIPVSYRFQIGLAWPQRPNSIAVNSPKLRRCRAPPISGIRKPPRDPIQTVLELVLEGVSSPTSIGTPAGPERSAQYQCGRNLDRRIETLHAFLRKPHGLYHLLERDLVGWVIEVLLSQPSQGAHGPGRVNTRFCLSVRPLVCSRCTRRSRLRRRGRGANPSSPPSSHPYPHRRQLAAMRRRGKADGVSPVRLHPITGLPRCAMAPPPSRHGPGTSSADMVRGQ
jgi:hypothetical protein